MDFTLMTYNTHSCVGMDGKTSPQRIADVIREYAPDVVALQELDMGLRRSGLVDQAQVIADQIRMDYHFHPTLFIEEGRYGNAIMTHFPMHVVRARLLPGFPGRTRLEKRGALWVELMVGAKAVQVIVVHMGLNRNERLAQARELTGPEWLASPQCSKGPVVLCGDLNAPPGSRVHRLFRACLKDAHGCAGSQTTWPGRFPFIRLDYIYVSDDISVLDCARLRSPLTRLASDHLPLVARLRIIHGRED